MKIISHIQVNLQVNQFLRINLKSKIPNNLTKLNMMFLMAKQCLECTHDTMYMRNHNL